MNTTGRNSAERRLAAILAADVAGYSRLIGADEEGTLDRLRSIRAEVVDQRIAAHRGRLVKTTGDGLLVEFASVVDALRCASEWQQAMAGNNAGIADAERIDFRIGINVGDVVVEDGDIFGDGVNVAARLEALADPGGICVSARVREDAAGRLDLAFDDLGDQELKNIARPVRVYRVAGLHAPRAQSPHPNPPPLAGEGVTHAGAPNNPPPQAGEGRVGAAAPPPLTLPDKPSIAVLPFQNMSGDPEQEYFVDGMVEEIITALSRIRWLFVIARSSTFAYKGRAIDVRQVARELGVRYVLEGSVRKAGNRVRITGQLIDSATRAHIWADRFDGLLDDVFDLQDQVASRVAGTIDPKLLEAEIERVKSKPTANLSAYDCFLRASANCHSWTKEGHEAALRLFYSAIELDSDYAQAYAFATHCYCWRKNNGLAADPEEDIRETARLARRAASLGKDDAFSLCWAGYSLAHVVGELEEGAALIDRALVLNPNLALAWNLSGWVRVWLDQPETAIEHLARAMRLSPLDPIFHTMETATANAHLRAGRYDEASLWAEKALRDQPLSADAARTLAISSVFAGELERAQKAMARSLQIAPTQRVSNYRAVWRSAEALAQVREALRRAGMPE